MAYYKTSIVLVTYNNPSYPVINVCKDKTIAHVHVTVLAYHILAGILKKLRTSGIYYDWNTIRNILATHIRVTTTMNTEDGHGIDVRTCTTPTEKQHMIYHKLHIKHTPLGRKYIKSSMKTQRCSAEK